MGKRPGLLFIAKHHWPGVLSLSGIYFASRKLKASCFVSYLRLLWGASHPKTTICYFSSCVKRVSLSTNSGFSRKENTFGMDFKLFKSLKTPSDCRAFGRGEAPLALLEERILR